MMAITTRSSIRRETRGAAARCRALRAAAFGVVFICLAWRLCRGTAAVRTVVLRDRPPCAKRRPLVGWRAAVPSRRILSSAFSSRRCREWPGCRAGARRPRKPAAAIASAGARRPDERHPQPPPVGRPANWQTHSASVDLLVAVLRTNSSSSFETSQTRPDRSPDKRSS